MTLRRKTILVMTITLIGLVLLLYLLLRGIMLNSFSTLENQIMLGNLSRSLNALRDDADTMHLGLNDWSNWDDTYRFTQAGSAAYIEDNLSDQAFQSLQISLMVFITAENEIRYAKAVDLHKTWQARIVPFFEDLVRSDDTLLPLLTGAPTSGFLVLDGEPVLIASRPILHSDQSGPAQGTLVWVRHLGAEEIGKLSESLRLALDLAPLHDAGLSGDFQTAQSMLSLASPQFISVLDEHNIGAYGLINDIYGVPALILRVTLDRAVYEQGNVSLNYFLGALVVVGIVFGAALLLLLEKLMLAPLTRLSERVRYVGDDFSMRLPIKGSDELAQLATAINTMLNTVSLSRVTQQHLNAELENRVIDRTVELERQKSQLQAIMDTMGEGLVYCTDGMIRYVNRAFSEMLGYSAVDLYNKPFNLLNSEIDFSTTPFRGKVFEQRETTLFCRDGSRLNVAITSTPVNEPDDRRRRVIIVRDITQELALKTQKDYFFARASHELRTPLANIITRLYLLRKKPERLDQHLQILDQVSDQMLKLVNDLLDISSAEQHALSLNRRDLVLQSLVSQVVDVQQADAEVKGITLSADLIETPLNVYADPTRLHQVITNLVSNAIHYTPSDGQIIVGVTEEYHDTTHYAVVRVIDNGIGISADNLAHIFDPFYRVNDEKGTGTGLGLSIVKEIVELHGGEICVKSTPGAGTSFTVHLALANGKHDTGALSDQVMLR